MASINNCRGGFCWQFSIPHDLMNKPALPHRGITALTPLINN
ncbi:hypothetical protein AP9108_33840 [Arthrospira sp. PCC 9108]|nr:hypothetical protein AP9108_33840 [Arthrospira sp. PCC 9108]